MHARGCCVMDWHLVDLHSDHALDLHARTLQRDLAGQSDEQSGGRFALAGLEHDAFADEITSWDPHIEESTGRNCEWEGRETRMPPMPLKSSSTLRPSSPPDPRLSTILRIPPEIVYRL